MANPYYGHDYEQDMSSSRVSGLAVGLLIGALAGAAAMLLYAPQSGANTRKLLKRKAEELVDTVGESYDETVEMARERGKKVSSDVRSRLEDAQQAGQDMLEEQKDRVKEVVEAGRARVKRR